MDAVPSLTLQLPTAGQQKQQEEEDPAFDCKQEGGEEGTSGRQAEDTDTTTVAQEVPEEGTVAAQLPSKQEGEG